MFPCEQSLNLFEYYDVLAGDIQSLPLNNTLESENTNTLAHFFFHFWIVFKYLLDFLESSLKIPCILTSVATRVFLDAPAFYVYPICWFIPFWQLQRWY